MPNRDLKRVLLLASVGVIVAIIAGCDPDPPPVGPSTSSKTPVGTAKAGPAACVGQPLNVSLTPVSIEVAGASATYPEIGVSPACDGAAGSAALEQAVNAAIADARADWAETWQEQKADLPEAQGSFDVEASVPVNVPGLVAITTDTMTLAGGPYPTSTLSSVTLDTSTGELITKEMMLAEMQEAGGRAWNFERELRRAARAELPSGDDLIADLTRDDVSFYPTKAGLSVSADGYFPHALGPAHFVIPWARLVGAQEDLRFVPDDWGH